jgi:plastocyanin
MRKSSVMAVALCLGIALVGAVGIAGASAPAKKPPVKLDGKVTNKGTKTAKGGAIEVEADDYYFKPTFIKAAKGTVVKVTVKNEGASLHTFTADDGSFDEQVEPGAEVTVDVTVPADGKPLAFHCDFHGSMGMKGAFFSKAGTGAGGTTKTTTSSGSSGGGYGY